MALVIQQPGSPGRFCLYDEDDRRFIATGQTANGIRALMVPRLVARGLTNRGAASRVGVLLAQATRLAADGPGRDSLWQMAQVGPRSAMGAGDIVWMSEAEAAANFGFASQPATTPVAPKYTELRRRFAIVGSVPVDGRPGEMVTVYLNAGPNTPAVWLGVLEYLVHEENTARWLQVLRAEPQYLRPGGPVVQDIHAAEVSLARVTPRQDAGQLATPAAPRGVKVTVGWVVARDYPARGATVREYLALRIAADILDLHGLWGEREEAVRLPQHQARALVRGMRRQGEDVRVVRLWRWVATG